MTVPPLKPILEKPPGYRDSSSAPKPLPKPPIRKLILPSQLNHKKQRRRSCFRRCCCLLCIFILLLIFVIIAAGGIFYLWFEPKLPVFHLRSFRFSQFNVTDKTDDTFLDLKTTSRIEINNPNGKLSLYYRNTEVEFAAGEGTGLGSKTFPGFVQAMKNVTSLKIETEVRNESIDGGTGSRLNSGYRSKEMVVNMVARTAVGLVVRNRRMVAVKINVVCGGVRLKSLEKGDMLKCSFHLRKWFL